MRGKKRQKPNWLTPTALIVAAVILVSAVLIGCIALWRTKKDEVTSVERGLGAAVTWVQKGFSRMADGVVHLFKGPYWDAQTVEEYLTLKQEAASLRSENEELEQLRQENARLLALLDVKEENEQSQPLFARVVDREQTAYTSSIVIDKGEHDGVLEDMAVISAEGLIGRVTQTSATWARVTCIISNDSGVPAMVEKTRDPGVVRGNLAQADAQALLTMLYLPDGAVVTPGDKVYTSGMGGVFAKGLLIGEVTSVQRGVQTSAAVVLSPAADFVHLEEVFVLTQCTDAAAAAAEQEAAQ